MATAVATRQELADFVVDNANGNAFATIDTGGAAGTCAGDEVACWLFDDGTANDPQNGINGTFMRGAHIVSDPVKGNVVSFSHGTGGPGSGDYVHLPVTPLLEIPVNITISAWVRYSGTFSGAWGARFIYKRCRDVGPDIHVPAGSGILRFAFTRGFPQRYNVDSTQDYNDDQWHHVAATYDGSTASLYVDGNLENSIPATGNIVYTHPHNPPHRGTSIGRNGDEDNRFWGGFIDEVKVWNRPLDAGEIQALSNAGSASFITIELTTQRRGRTHHLRSGVRTRN